jgi:glycerol-3-phosphate dehydrogenase
MTNTNKESTPLEIADILVIGGGINGAGIARDAAGRGLNVVLCEKDDLAQHTSSSSTKLIHGGLRYLEYFDFPLVRHALREREVLLKSAPHIIWPLRFLLPHHKALRPRWMIRLGLFLYDHIGGRRLLPASWGVDLHKHVGGEVLKPEFTRGFEYSDCWVQDARLVVLNVRDAHKRGARICTHTKCTALDRESDHWMVTLTNSRNGKETRLRARAVVNAAGPWVEHTLHLDVSVDTDSGVRLVKGSHIVVPRLFDHPYPYIFQNEDNRVMFAIPYEGDYTLLGTTEVEIQGGPDDVSIDDSEITYICNAINRYMKTPVKASDIVWSYTGVRPLFDDHSKNASKVTRDYVLQMDDDGPPILSVFGGKLTTYRKLSEQAVDLLKAPMGFAQSGWTTGTTLPGGDIENGDFEKFLIRCKQAYAWLDEAVLNDYARNYGSELDRLLNGCSSIGDLGKNFGGGLFECEVAYLMKYEWAETAEDILWRRTKKGLRVPEGTDIRLQAWMDSHKDHSFSPVW